MGIVLKLEVLHRRGYLAKRIANLCHGEYTCQSRCQQSTHTEWDTCRPHEGTSQIARPGTHDLGIVEPDVLCCVRIQHETGNEET